MATTVDAFIAEIQEAVASGVDIVELRVDFIKDFNAERDLERIMKSCKLPYIVTNRAKWEGGQFDGPEPERLATLKYAAMKGAPYVDVEFLAAPVFFASKGEVPVSCKVILSSHNFNMTPEVSELRAKAKAMVEAGADIVKIATMANDITDSAKVLSLLKNPEGGVPTIALAMGEKGFLTRLLASKYGGFLTFAAMSPEKISAPGQPDIGLLMKQYNYHKQEKDTKLFGIVGNPVSHSKSPLIHNAAFQKVGFDGVYVPLLVDDMQRFLDAFGADFSGFSVTIPHKEAALKAAAEVDPVAKSIGAVNTLIKRPDGKFKGFNTDMSASISAIERTLVAKHGQPAGGASPLAGKKFVIIGAGGAARALAFGAASKGAEVVVANRNRERAEQLVAALGAKNASVVDWAALQGGDVSGDVLANSTSVGMHPKENESPVPAAVVKKFGLVFDAVYTPLWTKLLTEAKSAGCEVVDGLQMFVGQAVDQFTLFTEGKQAPVELMQDVVLKSIGAKK